ncbi:MAG: hypothetical protein KDH94_09120, partial [Coxiellaceae bacterium]|nr:hypothetical protein [Coxiellaceae bacterium]
MVERGVTALIALLESEIARQAEQSAPYENVEFGSTMSAFSKIEVTDIVRQMIGQENEELYSLPLIRRGSTLEDLKHIERLTGNDAAEADHVAQGILSDVEVVTTYPPGILMPHDKHQFMDSLNHSLEVFGGQPYYDEHMLGRAKLADVPEGD